MRLAVLAAALAAAWSPACAGVNFQHLRQGQPADVEGSRALVPGQATLEDCLELLGAPADVERDQRGDGRVLTWEWEHVHGYGFFVSVPISDITATALDYDLLGRHPDRLRLIFDADWVLMERIEEVSPQALNAN